MLQTSAYKSVIRNAASIFLIKLFPALANVAVLVLYSRLLSAEDYGHYQNFWIRLLLIGTIAGFGIPVTIITYAAGVVKRLALQLPGRTYLLFGVWLLLGAGVFAWFERESVAMPWLIGAGVLVLHVLYAIQESLLIAAKRFNALAGFNVGYSLWFLLVHVWFAQHEFNMVQLFLFVMLPAVDLLPGY